MLLASLLLFALTRAEIIDRFNAAPVTRLSGLVQVHGNCPADMRREFQLPIASFATGVCRKLYEVEQMYPVKFAEPGIIIRIGDVREKLTNVVVSVNRREGGEGFTRIRIPSPSGADLDLFRTEIVKAFYWAVKNERIAVAAVVEGTVYSADSSGGCTCSLDNLAVYLAIDQHRSNFDTLRKSFKLLNGTKVIKKILAFFVVFKL